MTELGQKITIYTQGSLNNLLACPRSYELNRILGYRPKRDSEALVDGSVWHVIKDLASRGASNEHILKTVREHISNTEFGTDEKLEYRIMKYLAQKDAQTELQPPLNPQGTELKFQAPLVNPDTGRQAVNVLVAGILDGLLYDSGWWMVEYKTAAAIDRSYIEAMDMKLQLRVYKHYSEATFGIPIDGVIYDVIMKPSIIPCKKDPTPQDYYERVRQWYRDNFDKAFLRDKWRMGNENVDRHLWSYHKEILWRKANNHWPQNPNACHSYWGMFGNCPYLPLCKSDNNPIILASEYEKREIFPELKLKNMEVTG